MNVSPVLSRKECMQSISNAEIEQISRASIEHFALPLIAGISMDQVSQKEYEAMGGWGKKPEPLSDKVKLEMYTRIKNFIKPKIIEKITELVNSALEKALKDISDEELRLKVAALSERVMEAEPNWKKLPDLFKDHKCLFKDLEKHSCIKANLISFHDILCPLMGKYRDSGELFARAKLD
jgi:hypothetical protein